MLTGVGGFVVLVASLLPWHALSVRPTLLRRLSIGFSQNVAGTQGIDGKVALLCGVVLVVCAVVMSLAPSAGTYKAMAVIAVVAAVVAGFLMIGDVIGGERAFAALFRKSVRQFVESHTSFAPTDSQLDTFRSAFGIELSLRTGIFVAILGDLVALIGGAMGLTSRPA